MKLNFHAYSVVVGFLVLTSPVQAQSQDRPTLAPRASDKVVLDAEFTGADTFEVGGSAPAQTLHMARKLSNEAKVIQGNTLPVARPFVVPRAVQEEPERQFDFRLAPPSGAPKLPPSYVPDKKGEQIINTNRILAITR